MTTDALLNVALKRFRVENEPSNNYFLSVLFMDSGEKPLEPTAIVFDALEALKNKNLPGVANFNKLEGKAKTAVMMNDDNIIKVIINKRLNIFEKNYHLIRVYRLDANEKSSGSVRTYKTIGVGSNSLIEEVTEIVKEKFKVGNDVTVNHFLSTKLKSENFEKRRTPNEKIVDILATPEGTPIEVEFILNQEPATPETTRKKILALKNKANQPSGTLAAGTLSFLDGNVNTPSDSDAANNAISMLDISGDGRISSTDNVEAPSSERTSIDSVASPLVRARSNKSHLANEIEKVIPNPQPNVRD
ncbi:hypothetical protein HK100_010387 [Physocladia obscura]|uniref:Ras-associating domain-containing protein n=1 Tax=Physocladia obscura TaxID=109957 RepID=A0AAD5X9D3_9FUNG|nr:hypothetical protein HK100_010387 [Physocladia obscura]